MHYRVLYDGILLADVVHPFCLSLYFDGTEHTTDLIIVYKLMIRFYFYTFNLISKYINEGSNVRMQQPADGCSAFVIVGGRIIKLGRQYETILNMNIENKI